MQQNVIRFIRNDNILDSGQMIFVYRVIYHRHSNPEKSFREVHHALR